LVSSAPGTLTLGWSSRAAIFWGQFDAHLGDLWVPEAGDLVAGFIKGEVRLAPDDSVQRRVQKNSGLVPVHALHDGVIAHQVGHAKCPVAGQPHHRGGVDPVVDEESPRRCGGHQVERYELEGTVSGLIFQTGRPGRVENHAEACGGSP
jgi:hypothetical protein